MSQRSSELERGQRLMSGQSKTVGQPTANSSDRHSCPGLIDNRYRNQGGSNPRIAEPGAQRRDLTKANRPDVGLPIECRHVTTESYGRPPSTEISVANRCPAVTVEPIALRSSPFCRRRPNVSEREVCSKKPSGPRLLAARRRQGGNERFTPLQSVEIDRGPGQMSDPYGYRNNHRMVVS